MRFDKVIVVLGYKEFLLYISSQIMDIYRAFIVKLHVADRCAAHEGLSDNIFSYWPSFTDYVVLTCESSLCIHSLKSFNPKSVSKVDLVSR